MRCNFHSSELPGRIGEGGWGSAGLGSLPVLPALPHFPGSSQILLLPQGSLMGLGRTSRETQSLWTLARRPGWPLGWAKHHIRGHVACKRWGLGVQSRKQPPPCLLLLSQESPALSDSVLRRPTGGEEILEAEFSPELPPCLLLAMTTKPVSWPGLWPTESVPGYLSEQRAKLRPQLEVRQKGWCPPEASRVQKDSGVSCLCPGGLWVP